MATKFIPKRNIEIEEDEPAKTVLRGKAPAKPSADDDEELTVVKSESKQKLIKRDGKKVKITTPIETYNDGTTCENTTEEIIG